MRIALLSFCLLFAISIHSFSQHAINAIDIGAVDYVEVADNSNGSLDIGDGFTVEAWTLTGSAQSNQKVAGKIAGDFKNGFILGIQDGQVNMEAFDVIGTQTVLQTGIVPDTTWTHIAGTYEVGGMLTIYINGQKMGETPASSANHNSNGNPFRIGIAPWDVNALGFFGFIDEVRYWNTILDEGTLRDWMHKDLDMNHPGFADLGLYHKYDEGLDETTADMSSNGNDGALIGASWLPSTAPFKGTFDLFENDVRGIWLGQNEASSDLLTLTGSAITGDQSIVFANSDGGYDIIPQTATEFNGTLEKVWRATTQGVLPPSLEVSFDVSSIDVSQISEMFLVFDDNPGFSNPTVISGTFDSNTFTVPADFFFDGFYYALGIFQEGVSTGEINDPGFSFEITPNPNNGHFQLSLENPETQELQFKLMDITGKLIFETPIFPAQSRYTETFDFNDLSKGIYLLQVSDNKSKSTQKIVIN